MKLTISSDAMAATDPRVLGVARALFSGTELPASQQDFVFDFIGLVGLADPLRQSVPAAVRECQTAGIRVVMIIGTIQRQLAKLLVRPASLVAMLLLAMNLRHRPRLLARVRG